MIQSGMSVGPDVDAILGDREATPGEVVESNFSDMGTVHIEKPSEAPAEDKAAEAELLAGKFKTPEDLVKAYKELESKLGNRSEEPAEADDGDSVPAMGDSEQPGKGDEEASEDGESASDDEGSKPLDLSTFASEFAETGELSEDSFKALEASGIPREMVDQYIAGVSAIQATRGQELYSAAGGEDSFKALVKWGAANLPAEQRNAFDAAVSKAIVEGDFTTASMMVQAVKAQMGNGEPQLLNTSSQPAADGAKPFESQAEMAAAMRNPRYSKDPAYVAEVQRRLAVSDF